jgi:hypothetical protein
VPSACSAPLPDLVTTARTYTHVVADEREFAYAALLE